MIELEHSPLGGSAAHRFFNCTGSFLLQRAQIEAGEFKDVPSEYAERGTGAHELGAKALAEGREPFEYLGEAFNGFLVGWPDGIELDAVSVYVNECQGISARLPSDAHTLIEQTIKLPDLHPLLKGTVDFGTWHPDHGVFLRDYKNGEGIGVSAHGNKQLLYYAFLLIMSADKCVTQAWENPVSLGIVQPNFYGIFEEPDVWETTVGEVIEWGRQQLLPRMNMLTSTKDAPLEEDFVPGDHCQFCPVLLDCLKMQRAFKEYAAASEDFIVMLTDTELDHFYAQRELARRFMNALESTVHARLIGGGKIPSAKLVEKRVARAWKPGAEAALKTAFGAKAYAPAKINSPAQIEKLSSRGKEIALEWGYKPESAGLSVAPQSDPRPEAKLRSNVTVFEGHAQSAEDMGF